MSSSSSYLNFPQILSILMANRGLKVRDVVKATGIPQTTISNIIRGKSRNPRPLTLKLLSELFEITIEQLVGYDPLEIITPPTYSKPSQPSNFKQPNLSVPSTVPLLEWNIVRPWVLGKCGINSNTLWIANDACKSLKSFALRIKPSMFSKFFSSQAILLIDPLAVINDGCIVLFFVNESKEPSLRLLVIDGDEKRLQSLDHEIPSIVLTDEYFVVGPVVEVRYNPTFK